MSRLTKWLRARRAPTAVLTRMRRRQRIDLATAVHVGAHWGQERETYEAMGLDKVLWIEASADIYRRLVENMAKSNGSHTRHFTAHALVTDCPGVATTLRHFNNAGGSNSIFPSTNELLKQWPGLFETGVTETMQSDTLDRVATTNGFDSADLIAVDVQGAELLVLKGASKLLASAKAVIVEVSQKPYYAGGVLEPELTTFLQDNGFQPRTSSPIHGDRLYLRQ